MFRSRLTRETLIYGTGDFVGKLISFFVFPLIAAALSPASFGVLELVGTVVSLAGLFVSCGMNNAVQRYYWDVETEAEEQPVVVSTGLYTLTAFGAAAMILGASALPWLLPAIGSAGIPLGGLGISAGLVMILTRQLLQYLQDTARLQLAPWRFLTVSLSNQLLGVAAVLSVVLFWLPTVDNILAVQAIASVMVIPIALGLVRKDVTLRFDREWAKRLVHFGHPFVFAGIAYWLFGSMDRWMLAAASSIEETGLYSIAFRFASVAFFVSTAFGQAWSPYAIKVRADHPDQYRAIYAAVLQLLFFVMLVVGGGLALFSGELIGLVMPDEYAAAAGPLAVLCFGVMLQATQQVTGIGISLEKKTYLFSRIAWVAALVNLVGNSLLIPYMGAMGAAIATSFSYLVLTASYTVYTQRLHPLPIPYFRMLHMLLIAALVAVVARVFHSTVWDWRWVTLKAVFGLICIAVLWPILPMREIRRV